MNSVKYFGFCALAWGIVLCVQDDKNDQLKWIIGILLIVAGSLLLSYT